MSEETKAEDPRVQVLVTSLHQWGMAVEHHEARGLLARLDKADPARAVLSLSASEAQHSFDNFGEIKPALKPLTLRDALGELPEPYRSLALANEKHKTSFDWDGELGMACVESSQQGLDLAFHWQKTPQGREFWQKVYDGKNPPIPEPVASDEGISALVERGEAKAKSLGVADVDKVRPFPKVPKTASEQAQLNKEVADWTASQLSATGMHQISQEDRARLQVRAEKIETIQVLIDLAKCYDSMHGAKDEVLTKAKTLALEL